MTDHEILIKCYKHEQVIARLEQVQGRRSIFPYVIARHQRDIAQLVKQLKESKYVPHNSLYGV